MRQYSRKKNNLTTVTTITEKIFREGRQKGEISDEGKHLVLLIIRAEQQQKANLNLKESRITKEHFPILVKII